MIKVHLANIILTCVLGTLFLWPEFKIQPPIDAKVRHAYQSVCQITSGQSAGSGVLLESGYVVTAAHVVDRDQNGKIDEGEETVTLTFPSIEYETLAKVIHSGDIHSGFDIAIVKPVNTIPLPGIKLMNSKEYWKLNLGTPVYTIGMQSGQPMANITDGRIITTPKDDPRHRNSANSYFGNSGGGVFVGDELVGIASQLGMGRHSLMVPIYQVDDERRMFIRRGMVSVPYTVPLANQSIHISAPATRDFIASGEFESDPLWEKPVECPYKEYYSVIGFNTALVLVLLLIFRLMRRNWD